MGASNHPTDSRVAPSESVREPLAAEGRARVTLRPPDWTAPSSVSSIALERLTAHRATSRRTGSRAEVATLRAQLTQARARQDFESERGLSAKLARLLVRRGCGLAEATKLARRSLLMGEDPELREELSSWFASVGELQLAAGTLEALTERTLGAQSLAALWLRIAVLRARSGDAKAATQALRSAFEADPTDPLPLELLAMLRGWAPEQISKGRAAQALLEAARRRKGRGEDRAAFEDLLKAVEADPASVAAAERLGQHLADAGNSQAADEIWRSAVVELGASTELTNRRVLEALGASDPALALGATLDARADTRLDPDTLWTAASIVEGGAGQVPVPNFDGLLSPLGLPMLLAARLLWLGEAEQGELRAKSLIAAAKLIDDSAPHHAGWWLADALEADPDNDETVEALLDLAKSAAGRWVIEGFVRVARSAEATTARRALGALVQLAKQGTAAPSIGSWALGRLGEQKPLTEELHTLKANFERATPRQPALQSQPQWDRSSLAELRRVAQALADQPDQAGPYAEALFEALRREPGSDSTFRDLERVLWRLGRYDELERLWLANLETAEPFSGAVLGLLRLYHRHGATDKALNLLELQPERFSTLDLCGLSAFASLQGRPEQRALGFSLLAREAPAPVRAVLFGLASEVALQSGKRETAFRLAESACHANPKAARPVICCAEAARDEHPRVATLAFERASEVVVPRARYCRALVDLADKAGDSGKARRWAQRWLSLTPLEPEPGKVLLEQWERSSDAGLLQKGLDWWLGQPRPRALLAAEFGRGLLRLATLDRDRARTVAQRVLGAFGVSEPPLARALLEASRLLDEPALEIAVLERQLGTVPDHDNANLLLQIADLQLGLGDGDAAYDALARALQAGADVRQVSARLGNAPNPRTSDGELMRLHCRAECMLRSKDDPLATAEALRQLGATYWDLAGDRDNAVLAWERAAELDTTAGDESLAQDLIAFCGYADAVQTLRQMAAKRAPQQGSLLLLAGAAVALRDGFNTEAAALAEGAIELGPQQTEALAVLERAVPENDTGPLERSYEAVSKASLGVFGSRALHYRAARQFERRRQHALALEHAIRAFEAVPAQGVAYALMLRLANLLGDEVKATRAIGRVAETATTDNERAYWLELAARTAGPGSDGLRLKAEVLLRALMLRPEPEQIERLGEALEAVLEAEPTERDHWSREFDGALRSLLRGLDEPGDVTTALMAARTASRIFGNAAQCAAAIDRALQLDPNSSAFDVAFDLAPLLNSRASAARRVVEAIAVLVKEGRAVGQGLLSLGCELAGQHSPQQLRDFEIARALTEPINPAWVERATQLAAGNAALLAKLAQALPRAERAARLWTRVDELERSDPAAAIDVLEQQREASWLEAGEKDTLIQRLADLYRRLERYPELESLLMRWIDSGRGSEAVRRERALELCRLLARRSLHAAALDVLGLVGQWGALEPSELELGAEIARTSGDRERELSFLEAQQDRPSSDQAKRLLWQRLWQLHDALGHSGAAARAAERLLEAEPGHKEALRYLLNEAERQQDYASLVRLLEQRIETEGPSIEVYLQLSEVHARAIGEPEAAALVLEQALTQFSDNQALLLRLAEVEIERSEFERAAEVLKRAASSAADPQARAALIERAARCYLDAKNPRAVAALIEAESEASLSTNLLRLGIESARENESAAELETALQRLAQHPTTKADDRATALTEAAELALLRGDRVLATERALGAAKAAPRNATAQLLARRLEYQARGSGTSADALATITDLRGLGELSNSDQAALKSFLLAEALDRRVGLGAGERELLDCKRKHGAEVLVELGLAYRSAAAGKPLEALPGFEQALTEPQKLALVSSVKTVAEHALGLVSGLDDTELRAHWTARLQSVDAIQGLELEPSIIPPRGLEAATRARAASQSMDVARQRSGELRAATVGTQPRVTQPPVVAPAQPSVERAAASQTVNSEPIVLAVVTQTPVVEAPKAGPAARTIKVDTSDAALNFGASALAAPKPGLDTTESLDIDIDIDVAPDAELGAAPKLAAELAVARKTNLASTWVSAADQPAVEPRVDRGSGTDLEVEVVAAPLVKKAPPKPRAGKPSAAVAATHPDVAVDTAAAPDQARPEVAKAPAATAVGGTGFTAFTTGPVGPLPQQVDAVAAAALGGLPVAAPRARMSTDPGIGEPPVTPPNNKPATNASSGSHKAFAGGSEAFDRPSAIPPNPALAGQHVEIERLAASEEELLAGLRRGSVFDGERLLSHLQGPDRIHDRVNVCRQIVALKPGDAGLLARLLHAVVADNDVVYASALRHALLGLSDATRAPSPPPLSQQIVQPDALVSLLCGPLEPALEVLSLLWQVVPHLFRDPSPAPPEIHRLSSDNVSPLGQLNATLCRLMGTSRVQVYHLPGPRPVQLRLVLDQPVRLLVTGPDLADAPDFRFHFASMLLASRPEFALLYGLSPGDVKDLLAAVLAAFGPPGRVKAPATDVLSYAERLWEGVPARIQRRLQELTVQPELIDYDVAFGATNSALWRAGLFAAGDLGVSLLQVCAQEQLDPTLLRSASGLQSLCEDNARVAAVVRFATSVEYAEARWRPLRSASSSKQGRA